MRIGLGTGSTARHVVEVLGEALVAGGLRDIAGVATSRDTEAYARQLGIPLISLDARPHLDLCIDGADEVDPGLDLIKGLGGALLWERIVADASARVIIAVDESKVVRRLGERAPVPVEVIPFGWRTHVPLLEEQGCLVTLRTAAGGGPFTTDSGNYILDCRFPGGIPDPFALQAAAQKRVGIVATGLFLTVATHVVVGRDDDDADVLERPGQ